MENIDKEKIVDIPSYIKRPDLRSDEFPLMETVEDEREKWNLIISDLELYKELISKGNDLLDVCSCLDLTIYPEIHGGIGHPVDLLALFCSCHDWGVYPPSWVMNELYQRFCQYLKGNLSGTDKRRLGEFFGEPPTGRQSPYFKQRAFSDVMQSAMIAIDRLRFVHNISKDDAIGIVARRMEIVKNNTSHKFHKGEAAIEKAYKSWGKEISERLRNRWEESPPDQENTLAFLKTFPSESFVGFPHVEALLNK